jgi:hypothetical protein
MSVLRIPASINLQQPLTRRDVTLRDGLPLAQDREEPDENNRAAGRDGEFQVAVEAGRHSDTVRPVRETDQPNSFLAASFVVADDVPPRNRPALNAYLDVAVSTVLPDSEVELVGIDIFV